MLPAREARRRNFKVMGCQKPCNPLGKPMFLAKGAGATGSTEVHWAFAGAGTTRSPEAHLAIHNH